MHFLQVLSEFPAERERFQEIAERRALATEGAAEQMQYRRQERRLDLRHTINMERCILMGWVRLAQSSAIAGDSPAATRPIASVDASKDQVREVEDEDEDEAFGRSINTAKHDEAASCSVDPSQAPLPSHVKEGKFSDGSEHKTQKVVESWMTKESLLAGDR